MLSRFASRVPASRWPDAGVPPGSKNQANLVRVPQEQERPDVPVSHTVQGGTGPEAPGPGRIRRIEGVTKSRWKTHGTAKRTK